MAEESKQPIIVRRRKRAGGGHHGGSWKIAYADFVTAMMAFFLLLWLLGSTSKAELSGIQEYFQTPLLTALAGGSGAGDSRNIIKIGGGTDLTKAEGQIRRVEEVEKTKPLNLQEAEQDLERQEQIRLQALKDRLESLIEATPSLRSFKNQLLIDITSEGLRIQIVDEQNRPMFEMGRAELKPYTRDILHQLGTVLNEVPNRISLAGHTDATPYAGGERGYSNWELSADRANASRRELIVGSLAEGKVLRTVGLSSAVPFNKADPYDPVNRRISIIVLNKKTEEAILSEGRRTIDVGPAAATAPQIERAVAPGGEIGPPPAAQ
ncbi:MAG TPA: flagellar motor protein MotB [Burkholderiales bacterium]|nr:flagellar motor protein MotB [Burkholderiales bacterium]